MIFIIRPEHLKPDKMHVPLENEESHKELLKLFNGEAAKDGLCGILSDRDQELLAGHGVIVKKLVNSVRAIPGDIIVVFAGTLEVLKERNIPGPAVMTLQFAVYRVLNEEDASIHLALTELILDRR